MAPELTAQGTRVARLRGSRSQAATRRVRVGVAAVTVVLVAGLLLGWAYRGAEGELASGTRIAGVDVSGMTPHEARQMLERRSAALANVPVTFTAGDRTFEVRPATLGVTVDWARAVKAAAAQGGGFSVVRGYRRLVHRLFPVDVQPRVDQYQPAVAYEVGVLAQAIDHPARDARLVRNGLGIRIVGGEAGTLLDRDAAAKVIVDALADVSRDPVALPLRIQQPKLTAAELAPKRVLAARALSAPVTLTFGKQRFELTPRQLAPMLRLPTEDSPQLAIGGAPGNRYFANLARQVGRSAEDATFAVSGSSVRVVPAQSGRSLDVVHSAAAVLAAAERTSGRTAQLVVTTVRPKRSTAEARAMGITGIVGSYETEYGGVANRIHNVQLVAHLIDGTLVAPGATFSFNQTTGDRNAAKGFLEAPVIINGELETGLGGGVCQVSTTVFNAAFEAGLPITSRTNHALYISHYPLGRDATVDYPDIDLKFVNDTSHWLLLRTFVGSTSLVVTLYGAPQHRRVVTQTAPLRVVAQPPVERKRDADLKPGEVIVEDYGQPAQTTSVHREVYAPSGKLLYDTTWTSNYVASPKIVLIGPKPKPPAEKPATSTTGTTTTTSTTTTSTTTTQATTTTSTTAETTPSETTGR